MFRTGCFLIGSLSLSSACFASPMFPSGYVPFTSIYKVSAPDSQGDRLVQGMMTLSSYFTLLNSVSPTSGSVEFADSSIELAPNAYYSNVFVPTVAELVGDFSKVDLPLFYPAVGLQYAGNIIPLSLMPDGFAFVIGPQAAATPEPEAGLLGLIGISVLGLLVRRRSDA